MYTDPLAYFITWTTYGTWLPGDERWWVLSGKGHQAPSAFLRRRAENLMTEEKITLTRAQRKICEETIRKDCNIRQWEILALNCRTNHIHLIVAAPVAPKTVARQLKAWCTRRLKEAQAAAGEKLREHWWTEGESKPPLFTKEELDCAVAYVMEGQ
jgi:REP element-mobilizing transposase RayT